MSKELILKKCSKCGALIEVLQDGEIICCGDQMKKVITNSVDAVVEKHVPNYRIDGEKIIINVNHVMEEKHYIEWIAISNDNGICKKFLKPMETPEVCFKYMSGSKIYAYCNKHGLWCNEVE